MFRSLLLFFLRKYLPKPPTPPPTEPPVEPDPTASAAELACWNAHNDHRRVSGATHLTLSPQLTAQARTWAEQCALTNPSNPHIGFQQRLSAAGFGNNGSENAAEFSWIAGGMEATDAWMGSSGHRANMLNSRWTHCGFGRATRNGVTWWIALYGGRS